MLIPVLLPFCAPAQNSYGRFTGRVTDQQGATILGAKVKIKQAETNAAAATATNQEGVYDFLNQLPGSYVLSVEFEGFKKHTRSGLALRVGDIVELNIKLELGAVTDSVSVTAESPILETGSASLGQVVDNRMISEMPLAGRGVNYLMQLSPGAVSTNAPMHGWLPQARGSVSDFAVAGTRTRSSEFTLDGIPNMGGDGAIAFQPPPEMIQEFRVQTAAYDASLGRFAGASVNMVLKSGSNAYHGTLWGSHLSRPLMTHPFFINSNLYNTATDRPGETFAAPAGFPHQSLPGAGGRPRAYSQAFRWAQPDVLQLRQRIDGARFQQPDQHDGADRRAAPGGFFPAARTRRELSDLRSRLGCARGGRAVPTDSPARQYRANQPDQPDRATAAALLPAPQYPRLDGLSQQFRHRHPGVD